MSTLEATCPPHRRGTRVRSRLLALGAVIASGATALILTLSGANQAIGVAQARPITATAVVRVAPARSFHEPTTHTPRHLLVAGRNAGPSLTTVLFPLAPEERQRVLRIILTTPRHL
jgi:hypothetical protein